MAWRQNKFKDHLHCDVSHKNSPLLSRCRAIPLMQLLVFLVFSVMALSVLHFFLIEEHLRTPSEIEMTLTQSK